MFKPEPAPEEEIAHHVEHMRAMVGCTCEPEVFYSRQMFGHMLYLEHRDPCQYLQRMNAQWN